MKTITSVQNPDIKAVAALKDKKERLEQKQFIAEGIRTCSTLYTSEIPLVALYVTEQHSKEAFKLVSHAKITIVGSHVMEKISLASTPSGFLGVFAIPNPPPARSLTPGLVLTNINDPGNLGTLIRTCAAMNISSIVLIDSVEPWNPKVVQASAGTLGQVRLFEWSWEMLMRSKGNLKLYALVVGGGKGPDSIDPTKALLVVGSEAHGIPKHCLNACDEQITIPMPGNVESLNAAVAGAIGLYLTFGQQKK